MININGAGQTYRGKRGTVEALQDINLTVGRGEFLTLIGRSGWNRAPAEPNRGAEMIGGEALGFEALHEGAHCARRGMRKSVVFQMLVAHRIHKW